MVGFCSLAQSYMRSLVMPSQLLSIYIVLDFETNALLNARLWEVASWLSLLLLLFDTILSNIFCLKPGPVNLNVPVPARGRCRLLCSLRFAQKKFGKFDLFVM
jgi:hypothetical protein